MNLAPPPDEVRLLESDGLLVTLIPGPFEFAAAVPVVQQTAASVSVVAGVEPHRVSPGCYLVASVLSAAEGPPPRRADMALPIAELVASLELEHPLLIGEKIFEGALAEPGHLVIFPEGPLPLATPHTLAPHELADAVAAGHRVLSGHAGRATPEVPARGALVVRGHQARNPVDKFLYYFIALEVFPAMGSRQVANKVSDLLASCVYPTVDAKLIKQRTRVGRIEGLRAKIVHEGLALVDLPTDPQFG